MKEFLIHGSYLLGAALFVLGLKRMSRVRTAEKGNQIAGIGMLLAVVATLAAVAGLNWGIVIAGVIVGGAIGAFLAKKVEMTGMPELVALFNGLGGAGSMFVALSYYVGHRHQEGGAWAMIARLPESMQKGLTLADGLGGTAAVSTILSLLVGGVTLTGSLVAFAKLSGKMKGAPILLPARHAINIGGIVSVLLLGMIACFVTTGGFSTAALIVIVTLISLALGVLLVIPIGGADMPVVISLLNSYSGIAAAMTGFVLLGSSQGSLMLIVSGALVGAAGIILTGLMCKAMNRSLLHVLAGGFGDTGSSSAGSSEYTNVRSTSPEEVAMLLDGAPQVIIVPGYGLAVAQAQHAIAELDNLLTARGTTVKYAIHPVAGRMPGHMNVLLAEANVPYEKLVDMDEINPEFKNTAVAIVVGANDVVNPAAIKDPKSPIAGMPILNVFDAQSVIVIKRSLSPGYAGIKNELFEYPNTSMLFSDAKAAIQTISKELKDI
ncbi:MAG TPA: NAD(P)(+) transhydrogenase (Re/Si-specific) subunit beta [Planctomycetes bacterium]|nr:NAD(P)(+) transhydrogenase (Re/Si-specific) subunit beta [Planctomycetota bacterium]